LIEKFNFYDVYGYFVPGAAFLAILWIPFGLVRHAWPPSTWTDAIVAAILAYIVGHLLQSVATNAVPASSATTDSGQIRNFSETYLDPPKDPKDAVLPDQFRTKIQELVASQFGLDLKVTQKGDDVVDKLRGNAFLAARQMLIQGQAVSYAEQFQGMYALMRGLGSSFAIAVAYWLGWAASPCRSSYIVEGAVLLAAVSLLTLVDLSLITSKVSKPALRRHMEQVFAVAVLCVFFAGGYMLGSRSLVTPRQSAELLSLSVISIVASFRSFGAYRFFAGQFAAAVWRDYLAYNVSLALNQKPESGKK
jgi:hypothetical protein